MRHELSTQLRLTVAVTILICFPMPTGLDMCEQRTEIKVQFNKFITGELKGEQLLH